MNRWLLLLIFCFGAICCQGQMSYLFVKKGAKKKRTYHEYDRITLLLSGDSIVHGMITRLANDTIFLSGNPVPVGRVNAVIIRNKKEKMPMVDANTLLLITGGVALTTAGLTLSNQATFKEALTAGLVIGYAPLLVQYLGSKIKLSLSRKQFKIGKKFQLQLLDFYLPAKRAF